MDYLYYLICYFKNHSKLTLFSIQRCQAQEMIRRSILKGQGFGACGRPECGPWATPWAGDQGAGGHRKNTRFDKFCGTILMYFRGIYSHF